MWCWWCGRRDHSPCPVERYNSCAHRAFVLVADPEAVERSHDKWLTAQWFARQKLLHPVTVRTDDRAGVSELIDHFGRIVIKPRFGFGSRGLVISTNATNSWRQPTTWAKMALPRNTLAATIRNSPARYFATVTVRFAPPLVMQRELLHGTSYRIYPSRMRH